MKSQRRKGPGVAACDAASFAAIGIAMAAPCAAFAESVHRLGPSVFAAAPAAVRSGLTQQGCTVPQSFLAGRPENVVRGSFTKPGGKEWAALCSVGGFSEILVFGSKSTKPLARFAKAPDENFVQVVAAGRTGYSRRLYTVPLSGRRLKGIEDAFLQKASTVWIYEHGRWEERRGVD